MPTHLHRMTYQFSGFVISGPFKGQSMTQKHIQHTEYHRQACTAPSGESVVAKNRVWEEIIIHRKQYHSQPLITPHLVISLFPSFSTSIDLPPPTSTSPTHISADSISSLFIVWCSFSLSLFQRHAHILYTRMCVMEWSLETMRSALCLSSCISYCILRRTGHLMDLPSPTSLTKKHVYVYWVYYRLTWSNLEFFHAV